MRKNITESVIINSQPASSYRAGRIPAEHIGGKRLSSPNSLPSRRFLPQHFGRRQRFLACRLYHSKAMIPTRGAR